MDRRGIVLCILLAFSFATPGCFSEPESFYYSVEDPEKNTNSVETSDVLFNLILDDDGGADMDISDLVVTIERSGSHICSTSPSEGNCTLIQSGDDDSTWEIGETLSVTENGFNICSQHCIIAFSVEGPEGAKIVGPTILNST